MKIPPQSLYIPKEDPNPKSPNEQVKEENDVEETEDKEKEEWQDHPYDIERTLEKLDYEDRKWLLFQLVLCRPVFMEEVMLGFPVSLVADDDVIVNAEQLEDKGEIVTEDDSREIIEGEGTNGKGEREGTSTSGNAPDKDEDSNSSLDMTEYFLVMDEIDEGLTEEERRSRSDKRKAKQKEDNEKKKARLARKNSKKAVLLPILVPESEWLLTYCQIDAIPSETRDEFLTNLFLMSSLYSSILETFYSSLKMGRINHETYVTYPDEIEWKKRFNKANEGRKVLAKAGMGVDYGCVGYWEELGEGREGVWDVALCELGGWLMRDLPDPCEPRRESKSSKVEISDMRRINMDPKQEGDSRGGESEYDHTPEWCVAQDYIKVMAFIIQTKTLSLVRQITRPDSASDSWPGRYRYKALTINDMVKLSVLLTRSPLPLRKLLHDEIRSISAEIVILFDELEGAECEWVRVDDDLAWDLECVQRGLNDVEYRYLWEGVMTAWYMSV